MPVKQVGCCVCGMRDARALVEVKLADGAKVTLCGSHELMHRRGAAKARTAAELRTMFADRRGNTRRGSREEVDELAEKLSAAFSRERRGSERRAS